MHKIILGIVLLFINFTGFTDNILFRIPPMIIFSIVIFDEIVNKRVGIKVLKKFFSLFFFLALMVIIGGLRTGRMDISMLFVWFRGITLILFLVAFLLSILNELKKKDYLTTFIKFVFIPAIIFVSLNLLLFILGFYNKDYEIGDSIILSYFGITISRVEFFLSSGINAYGSFIGIFFNISLLGIWVLKKSRIIFLIGLINTLVSLLLTDSRGPIIYSILILLLIKFIYSKVTKPRFLGLIPFIGLLGPILLLTVLSLIAQTDYGSALSRSSGDLATGNSRSIIWGIAASDFIEFKPEHHIFGYGEFGQYTSGLSPKWAFVFGDNESAEFMHPHNTFLSIALDYGYFGLLLFTLFQFSVVRIIQRSWNSNRNICYILLGNLLYFNLVGIGETMFGFYYQNVIYLFFMINSFAFVLMIYQNKFKKLNAYSLRFKTG